MRNKNELVIRDPATGDLQIIDCVTGELISTSSKPDHESIYVFTYEKALLCCQEVAKGKTLAELGNDPDYPPLHVINHWLRTDKMFQAEMGIARKARAEYFHDQVVGIAKNACDLNYTTKEDIANVKLAADQFRWLAEKGKPETYGPKITHEGNAEKPIVMRVINTGINRAPDVITTAKEVTHEQQDIEEATISESDSSSGEQCDDSGSGSSDE